MIIDNKRLISQALVIEPPDRRSTFRTRVIRTKRFSNIYIHTILLKKIRDACSAAYPTEVDHYPTLCSIQHQKCNYQKAFNTLFGRNAQLLLRPKSFEKIGLHVTLSYSVSPIFSPLLNNAAEILPYHDYLVRESSDSVMNLSIRRCQIKTTSTATGQELMRRSSYITIKNSANFVSPPTIFRLESWSAV